MHVYFFQDFGESQTASASKSSSNTNSNLTIIKRFNHHSTRILKTAQDHTRSLQTSDQAADKSQGEKTTTADQSSEYKVGA